MKILIIEDEYSLADAIAETLQKLIKKFGTGSLFFLLGKFETGSLFSIEQSLN